MRVKLSKENYNRLKLLVKQRDRDFWDVYERVLGIPYPTGEVEVHHVHPNGSGGEDREDNLLTLSAWTHRTVFHTAMGLVDKKWQQKALKYLGCKEVRRWRWLHRDALKELYRTAEEARIKKIRRGCIPKKPKWARF